MSTPGIRLALAIRSVLVLLPSSTLDMVLDFRSAVAQAQEAVPATIALILVDLFVELFCVGGSCFRDCGSCLCIRARWYHAVTALVWKQI